MKKNKNELMTSKARTVKKVWVAIVLGCLVVSMLSLTCFAAENDPVEVVNNLSDFSAPVRSR